MTTKVKKAAVVLSSLLAFTCLAAAAGTAIRLTATRSASPSGASPTNIPPKAINSSWMPTTKGRARSTGSSSSTLPRRTPLPTYLLLRLCAGHGGHHRRERQICVQQHRAGVLYQPAGLHRRRNHLYPHEAGEAISVKTTTPPTISTDSASTQKRARRERRGSLCAASREQRQRDLL